jgi:hypothetical protein
VIYTEIEGSMILKREGWKEIKSGWVFKSLDGPFAGKESRGMIIASQ